MKVYKIFLSAFAGISIILIPVASYTADTQYSYVGVESCGMCHEKQYNIWKASAHARAFDVLNADEKLNTKCLSCHTTNNTASLRGVQCEACHGPGSGYSDMETMKNFKKVWNAGLNRHLQNTCIKCHNKNSPTFKGFDFKTYWMEIMH